MIVKKIKLNITWVLISFIFINCNINGDRAEIWIDTNNELILGISETNFKLLHSGVPHCMTFSKINYENKALNNTAPILRSSLFKSDTIAFNSEGDIFQFGNYSFSRFMKNSWDSIVYEYRSPIKTLRKNTILNSGDSDKDILFAILNTKNFNFLDTAIVAEENFAIYQVWDGAEVVIEKVAANNFLCLDIF